MKYYIYDEKEGVIIEREIAVTHPDYDKEDDDYIYIWCCDGYDYYRHPFYKSREVLKREILAKLEAQKEILEKALDVLK
jgi:hypothetical protein